MQRKYILEYAEPQPTASLLIFTIFKDFGRLQKNPALLFFTEKHYRGQKNNL